MARDAQFWQALEQLLSTCELVIDRPRGARHPRCPDIVYPLDYGYLEDTRSMDGAGIDVWRGSMEAPVLDALIVTVDLWKRDSEIKLLVGCTEAERDCVLRFHNEHDSMKGLLVCRPNCPSPIGGEPR